MYFNTWSVVGAALGGLGGVALLDEVSLWGGGGGFKLDRTTLSVKASMRGDWGKLMMGKRQA